MSDAPGLETPDREDEVEEHPLTPRLFAAVEEAIEAEDGERLRALLDDLHAADIADFLEQVDFRERQEILRLFPGLVNGDVLSELDEGLREEVIGALSPEALAVAVRELDSDDVVDLIEDFEATDQATVLAALDATDRVAVEQALAFPEYSAGRMMQRETVVAPEHWNVGQAIDHMRAHDDLPDEFYHVILVDPRHRPTGYVSLGKIMSQPRKTRLAAITEDSFRTIDVLAEEGDVAYAFNQYHLISAPVTDAEGRLVGVITIDDAMIVLDDELEEDILRLAGVGEEGSSLSSSVREILRGRFPWLAVNLVTAILASMVISLFEGQIAQVVALAVLMPIVASMGGNAGTQSLDRGGARDRHARPHRVERGAGDPARDDGGAAERAGLRGDHGAGRRLVVRDAASGTGDRGGDGDQPRRGGAGGNRHPGAAGTGGDRPGAGLGRLRHHGDRCGGVLRLPRPRRAGAAVSYTDAKAEARKRAYALRAAAKREADEGAAQDHLRAALAAHAGAAIAGYLPIRTEIDPLPVMAGWSGPVAVPVIDDAGLPLRFARWHPGGEMVDGGFGTRVPAVPDFLDPDVLIVPLVALDREGYRLGYGGGFYDRTLARMRAGRGVVAIGFAFSAQILETLPRESTDERLDLLVTEDGVRRFA